MKAFMDALLGIAAALAVGGIAWTIAPPQATPTPQTAPIGATTP